MHITRSVIRNSSPVQFKFAIANLHNALNRTGNVPREILNGRIGRQNGGGPCRKLRRRLEILVSWCAGRLRFLELLKMLFALLQEHLCENLESLCDVRALRKLCEIVVPIRNFPRSACNQILAIFGIRRWYKNDQ